MSAPRRSTPSLDPHGARPPQSPKHAMPGGTSMATTIVSRLALFTCSASLLAATPALALDPSAPGGKAPPKLVLFMVVDGFPQEQLVKYYDQYGERGFKLFLDRGAWYANNHYSHATTYTGVGH